jgi:hypothetical protein
MMFMELPTIPEDGLTHEITGVGKLTVRAMVVVAVTVPEPLVPVMVTVAGPVVAVLVAVNVATLVVRVGLVPNATVTPLGSPAAERLTSPTDVPMSVTVRVSVAVPPWTSDNAVGEAASEKFPAVCGASVQTVPLIENDAGIWLLTPFQLPSNPMLVWLAPAAVAPL